MEEIDDPEVGRLWLIAQIARTFGISPIQAREELEDDAEGLLLKVLPFHSYAEAYAAYRRADATELKAWRESRMMRRVEEIDAALVQRKQHGD